MNAIALPKQYFEVTLEDNAIFPDIMRAIKMIRGIASVRVARPARAEEMVNATTAKAIEDVRAGKTYKASSVDDLLNQCLA